MSKEYQHFKTCYELNLDVSLLDVKINKDLLKDRISYEDETPSDIDNQKFSLCKVRRMM